MDHCGLNVCGYWCTLWSLWSCKTPLIIFPSLSLSHYLFCLFKRWMSLTNLDHCSSLGFDKNFKEHRNEEHLQNTCTHRLTLWMNHTGFCAFALFFTLSKLLAFFVCIKLHNSPHGAKQLCWWSQCSGCRRETIHILASCNLNSIGHILCMSQISSFV